MDVQNMLLSERNLFSRRHFLKFKTGHSHRGPYPENVVDECGHQMHHEESQIKTRKIHNITALSNRPQNVRTVGWSHFSTIRQGFRYFNLE